MKKEDKNKNHSEEFVEDENLTFRQEELEGNDNSHDNMSEDDKDSLKELDEIEVLQNKYDELNNSYLRLHAEFDNYRKRTLKEKVEIIKAERERVLTDIYLL